MKYTHLQSKRGRWFREPPPTIHLRTSDVRDNIHPHLCHAKCPMTVGGGGGGGGNGRFPLTKCDFCSEM